ncbi:MAG TPA: chromosome segregation protein SMC [Candidatus Dormibacteraeota bacterium]|nr:chromosome segregation protein SMC [Candidatus Dormibacteraeota bacterium]
MLKLRKVELLGFKSFCEKTPITFSGSGITCIVGPNGCGKSNVVDAISWVLGEQSHKMLRAERMSDCIFNGTAKRPPMGLSEVTLTLVDPELSEAVAKVLAAPENHTVGAPFTVAEDSAPNDSAPDGGTLTMPSPVPSVSNESAETDAPNEELAANESEPAGKGKPWKKRGSEKPAMHLKPGEVVVGRRLYRSGQSEYVINGRVARLRDVQELFMGMGLGPDSYAIIEQGRIGQILNSKPMDRRAIIEEAAGITMYKTKRRLAEAKLEASKINLSRVNDILVEVEKQLASLKRQASKARRYSELREQMRGLLRIVLASKAEHLDIEAARLEKLLRDMEAAEERDARSVHELEAEQERLNARTYELDAELRQTHNLLGQTSLDLDRAENRITFNREQLAQLASRSTRVTLEIEQAERLATDLAARMNSQREAVTQLREQSGAVESSLREATEKVGLSTTEQERLEASMAELRALAGKLVEESARMQAESLQAEEAAARHTAAEAQRSEAARTMGIEWAALALRVKNEEDFYSNAERRAEELGAGARDAQARLVALRGAQQETAQHLKQTREALAAERARHSAVEQILSERAYTADAVQKLFNAGGEAETQGFHAVGLLADYAEVQEQYEGAIEQFLRDELEYVVVESFDQARAGVALLRDEMGGRATFFVDSLSKLNIQTSEIDGSLPMAAGVIARLDRLVDFRDPLGPAAKHFLTRLRTAYLVETGAAAETLAHENPHSYYLTLDGTCYHGRMVSGGRQGDAGPLALKRELRQHEAEAVRLDRVAQEQQEELTRIEMAIAGGEIELAEANAKHVEAEKSFVGAMHTRDQARAEHRRVEQQLAAEQQEIAWLHQEAGAARNRVEQARNEHAEALRSRANAEADAAGAAERLSELRRDFQSLQEQVVAQREALATMTERFTSAKAAEQRLVEEMALAGERTIVLHQQHGTLLREKTDLEAACEQLALQVEDLRKEKIRAEELKASLEKEWDEARARAGQLDESLRGKRQSLDELRSERGQRQIEKARNDADRDYLRQNCVAELNAQPEELMAQESQLLIGEELIAAETNYNEMKARVDAMGPVNMMALEEFKECEEREIFMRRERDDLVQSIENTQLTITELDQVSRQKFEEAFNFINSQFAVAFQSLFGGGHGEMRLGEPDSSGEMGIDIVAQPPGKRLQNILLLSGGEKALTALALLIAVFRYQPSPFCILDEVDAPLDEANVGRFNKMLADMCGQTQFIVVTHNRKTMEMGSVLYGVTMQEPGVSKLVSVKWEEAEQASTPKAASNAA